MSESDADHDPEDLVLSEGITVRSIIAANRRDGESLRDTYERLVDEGKPELTNPIDDGEVVCIWKTRDEAWPDDVEGVITGNVLMALAEDYPTAMDRIEYLEQNSSMDGYAFTTSVREIVTDENTLL